MPLPAAMIIDDAAAEMPAASPMPPRAAAATRCRRCRDYADAVTASRQMITLLCHLRWRRYADGCCLFTMTQLTR